MGSGLRSEAEDCSTFTIILVQGFCSLTTEIDFLSGFVLSQSVPRSVPYYFF